MLNDNKDRTQELMTKESSRVNTDITESRERGPS